MAADPKKYIEAFFNITKGYMKENESTSTVKFLRTAIDGISSILSKIDKYLLSQDINVKDEYKSIKEKLSDYKEKTKTGLTSMGQEVKQKGIKSFITDKKNAVVGKIKEKFSNDTEKSGAPPEDKQNPLYSLIAKLSGSIDNLTAATNDKVDNDEEKKSSEKESRLSRFRNMLDQQKARADKRKKEVEAEKNRFGEKGGKKEGKGIFGMLLSAIGGLGGMILGGFKSILLRFVPMVAGLAGKGIVRTITGLVPWMMKRIVPSLALGMKGLLGTVAKGALSGGAALLGGAAKAAGTAALGALTGTAGLVLGGIVLAGAAIYGGYKLYKYLNRNSTGDGVYGDLTRLRLHLYGFNDTNREHYHKLFDLEMLMKNYHEYRNNNVILKKFDGDFKKKVLDLFEVTREEKEKYNLLNTWFMKRFIPAYKAFMEAFYSANSKLYLDDIDKLKEEELFKLISVLRIPTGIYDIKSIPVFSNPDSVVDKQQIDDLLNNIREGIKRKTDEGKGRKPGEISQENKGLAKDNKTAQDIEAKAIRDRALSNLPKDQPGVTKPNFNSRDMQPPAGAGQEGEGKPPEQKDEKLSDKASTSINKATGALLRGNKTLEGISTKLDMSKIYNLDPNVLELFSGMAKEYNTLTGKVINVNEAFRSKEDQAAIFSKYGPGRAARPGTSLHEHGLAIDINSATADELDKLGLMRKYGFTRPIGGEKWHIEPAGVTLNPTLARDNPASRVGAVMTSPGRGGGGYATESGATQYKRNVALQKSIYESGSSTEIDPMQAMKKKLEEPVQAGTTGQSAVAGMQAPQPSGVYTQQPSASISPEGSEPRNQSRVNGTVNVYTNKTPSSMGDGAPMPDYERKPPSGVGAVMTSPGRGGGGYATEASATKYKRNVALQKAIYESGSSTEIDPMQAMKKKLEEPAQTGTTGQSAVAGMQAPQPSGVYNQQPSVTAGAGDSSGEPRNQSRVNGTVNLYTNKNPSPMGDGTPMPDFEKKPPSGLGSRSSGLDQGPTPPPTYNGNMDPSKMGNMSPQDAIRKAASVTGMNPDTMMAFAKIESGLRPGVSNPKSSATGLFQITSGTWKGLMNKYGKQYNIPPDAKPTDPYYNSLLGSLYAKENLSGMGDYKKAGIREDVALYLAHHYGSAGGNRIIRAAAQSPDSHVAGHMTPGAYSANTSELGGKSVGQYIQYLTAKMDRAGSKSSAPQGPMPTQGGMNAQATPTPSTPSTPPTGTPAPIQAGPPAPTAAPPVRQAAPQPTLSPFRPTLAPPEMPVQPSKALSLDKTESLLSDMNGTLVAIRDILKSIDGKGGMQDQGKEQKGQPPASTPGQQQQPIVVDNNRQPSGNAVSMSRRPVQA